MVQCFWFCIISYNGEIDGNTIFILVIVIIQPEDSFLHVKKSQKKLKFLTLFKKSVIL